MYYCNLQSCELYQFKANFYNLDNNDFYISRYNIMR